MRIQFLLCLLAGIFLASPTVRAAGIPAVQIDAIRNPVNLKPFFQVLYDASEQLDQAGLYAHPELFLLPDKEPGNHATGVTWLRTTLKATGALVLFFAANNYVDLYLYKAGSRLPVLHRQAGIFRPQKALTPGDSRFHFLVPLDSGISYTVLLKVRNTNGYLPNRNFLIDQPARYNRARTNTDLVDIFMLGAFTFLFFYTCTCWWVTHYRPYGWLAMMLLGITLYNLSISRFFIDWFAPDAPVMGWLPINIFTSTALSGFYFLTLDFLKVKDRSRRLFRYGQGIGTGALVLALLTVAINGITGNFFLSSRLYLLFSLFPISYFVYLLRALWAQLNREEGFFCFGLMAYLLAAIWIAIINLIIADQFALGMSLLTKMVSAFISIVFLTCLNSRLRQNEKDRVLYLDELNRLQQHQNELLEEKVQRRTEELTERNLEIETLMNELNHRVKNNLQLLYSLNSLQLPVVKEQATQSILKDNIARIKAMILVNDHLNPVQGNASRLFTSLEVFITDITTHCSKMFSHEKPVSITLDIQEELTLDPRLGLSLGLIVSELMTNSFKHAFTDQPEPAIRIRIFSDKGYWNMQYADNGCGIKNIGHAGFGLTLVHDLARQIRATVTVLNEKGLSYIFKFAIVS
jgi:two-component sensor histidine kinase